MPRGWGERSHVVPAGGDERTGAATDEWIECPGRNLFLKIGKPLPPKDALLSDVEVRIIRMRDKALVRR